MPGDIALHPGGGPGGFPPAAGQKHPHQADNGHDAVHHETAQVPEHLLEEIGEPLHHLLHGGLQGLLEQGLEKLVQGLPEVLLAAQDGVHHVPEKPGDEIGVSRDLVPEAFVDLQVLGDLVELGDLGRGSPQADHLLL
jgi:hypothetical protein